MADRYDIDRERERERRGRDRYGEARYEDYDRDRREGGEETWRDRGADYGNRGDWGPAGRWGSYGNRADYDRENIWREGGGQGGQRGNRTNLSGAGFSSYGAATGPYTGGMGSYYGERERGNFAGRGPKGWRRSDERIREDINERLTDHPHIDASELEVQVQNGEVTLSGTVDERHAKRLAEDIVDSVSGVREVHNNIRVIQQGSGTIHQTR